MNNMKRTNIIVWLDDDETWDRVYIKDGRLYVKIAPYDYKLLADCNVREIDRI